ncbi:MAG: glycosyltransferase [Saprospiraceae bacterium]
MAAQPALQLSIIIVNYNVRYFLEQALWAVQLAAKDIQHEIWLVDNDSKDDSLTMVRERFPAVKIIANKDNPGFSIANNQAIRQAQGEHILLLNPDTIVREDTFHKCLAFMEHHPNAGALGVRMLDGSGQFLPESKRGFPTPFVAFCKTFGLSKLFPKSEMFNRYHLGFLSEKENHVVEVLAGAFMWMRKEVLDEVGLLDESFFMYGEDIDLSYRIVQAGYQNYYLAETEIIHYKGESTKKGSLNYVRVFYQAMIIFAKKHFQGEQARLFVFFLQMAIYLRAFLTLFSNLAKRAFLPILDLVVLFGGLYLLKDFWGVYHFDTPNYYGRSFLLFNAPLYTVIWLITLYFNGAYDKGANARRIVSGILIGTVIIAAIYGFLDMEYRTSRMLILLGTFWNLIFLNTYRGLLSLLGWSDFSFRETQNKRLIIVGSEESAGQVQDLLGKVRVQRNLLGMVTPRPSKEEQALGTVKDLAINVRRFRANELIYCLADIPPSKVMESMQGLGPKLSYRTWAPGSSSIIGSSSKNASGDLYTQDVAYQINKPLQRRSKRVLDIGLALFSIVLFPIHFLWLKHAGRFLINAGLVLIGQKTWVAYLSETNELPKLRKGVIPHQLSPNSIPLKTQHQLDFFYAKDYHWLLDLRVLGRAYFGRAI